MVDEVVKYFYDRKEYIEFKNLKLDKLNNVFASPEKIFGIAKFEDDKSLKSEWEKVSQEFAIRIQSRIVGPLYNLKWDLYLILIVENDIGDAEMCKKIEVDRNYFRKIVLAKNSGDFQRKLPIELELGASDHLEVYSDTQYLDELKKVVSDNFKGRFDFNLYENHSIDQANDEIFLNPYKSKGAQE